MSRARTLQQSVVLPLYVIHWREKSSSKSWVRVTEAKDRLLWWVTLQYLA